MVGSGSPEIVERTGSQRGSSRTAEFFWSERYPLLRGNMGSVHSWLGNVVPEKTLMPGVAGPLAIALAYI